MRKTLFTLLFLGMLTATASAKSPFVVELPQYEFSNTKVFEIEKIEVSKGMFKVFINVFLGGGTRTPFTMEDVKITAGENTYMVTSIDGQNPDGTFSLERGEGKLVLNFPRLHKGVKAVDLTGRSRGRDFKIGDIDVTGKRAQYVAQLPEQALTDQLNGRQTLPEPQMKIGTTVIKIHLSGIKEGQDYGAAVLSLSNPFTREWKQLEPVKEGNTLTFRFEQYATGKASIALSGMHMPVATHPGENVDIWVDITAMNLAKIKRRADLPIQFIYFDGELSDINNAIVRTPEGLDPNAKNSSHMTHSIDFPIKSIDQYVTGVVKKINDDIAEINSRTDLSGEVKEAMAMDIKTMGLNAIGEMGPYLSLYGYERGNKSAKLNIKDNIDKLGPLYELNMNDPKLLYGRDFGAGIVPIAKAVGDAGMMKEISGTSSGWMWDGKIFDILLKAETMQDLTSEQENTLSSASPYYQTLYAHIKNVVDVQYAEAMGSKAFVIRDTPEYENVGDILDNIVAMHPGKIIFVDFWATWCGPCLAGMRTIKPLKPWMKENDIVSIYIGDTSSPTAKWTLMLPDIGGEHYYLTAEEIKAMSERYKYSGIPTYMIFDKQGNKVYQTSGFPGNDRLKSEFQKVL